MKLTIHYQQETWGSRSMEVTGTEVFFKGYEEFKFALHKDPFDPIKEIDHNFQHLFPETMIISEVTSGAQIGHGDSIQEAMVMAQSNLDSSNPDDLKSRIQSVKDYIKSINS